MFTSAELIEALRRRLRRSIRPLPRGEAFPPGWQAWFDAMRESLGAVTGARAREIVEVVVRGGPRPRLALAPPANGWQAFMALWQEPGSPDERGLRVLSRTLSILLHLLLVVMLSWLMHARFLAAPAPAQRGEHVIEVEFIGQGTPDEEGGGAPPDALAAEEVPEQERPPEASPPAAEPQPAPEPVAPPPAVADSEPAPPAEPPPAESPLVVTETPLPDGLFQLPPPRPVDLPQPQLREVEVAPRAREIELAEVRELEAPAVRQVEVEAPELEQPQLEVAEREIVTRPRAVPVPEMAAPVIQAPELSQAAPEARVREIPMPPAPEPGQAASDARAAARAAPSEGVAGQASQEPDDGQGRQPDAAVPGRGTAPAPGEGAWATPRRGDDWGASDRDQPGGQQGTASLFNPDGSPRLPPGSDRVGGGLPPGTITEDYEKIDRMGTWLRRPPTDYEPTSFDRFWVPHESLLQEWVRRSVRTVLIPIPGTSKSIRCDVVTLAVAGGCGIVDPNLQDDPAGARPPPDIPFRPELHEDQEGLGDDVWD